MQSILLAVSLIASLVASQSTPSVGSLPSCAIPCITNGIAATGCATTDVHCFCTATSFLQSIAPCVYANCSPADQNLTQTVAQGICNAASPPVQLPSFSSLLNTSSSASASASASESAAASSSAAAASSTGGGAAGSTSAVAAASSTAATKSSASGKGDMRDMVAVGAMVGVMAIAFLAV